MPRRSHIADRSDERRRILLITEDSILRVLISGFLVTMGCACAMVSTADPDAIVEREMFDAVLLDIGQSETLLEHLLQKVRKNRPRLWERILLIRRSFTDAQSIELMGRPDFRRVSDAMQMPQLWAILQEEFTSRRASRLIPRRLRVARMVFDSSTAPAAPGVRGRSLDSRRLAYEHRNATIDFLIEPTGASGRMWVTGQLLSRAETIQGTGDLPVLLVSGIRTLARTKTNSFGEFRFECEVVEEGCIEIRLGEGAWISLPLGSMDWQKRAMAESKEIK